MIAEFSHSTIDRRIVELDLSMIRLKLQDKEEGRGWSEEYCLYVEQEYKRFLFLKLLYSEKEIVPNKEVDNFWHQHILDTEKYAEDCIKIFGRFLHHYPYFGMKDEEDYKNLCDAFEETKELYKNHFGIEFDSDSARCRTACKPVKCK